MRYFGTDGIRGLAYEYINYDLAYAVGRSMGLLEKRLVIVSRDTRESGTMIVKAIKAGVIDAGLEVLDLDIQPTPLLAYLTIKEKCYGIMVTASHNPFQDNGIKVFNQGKKSNKTAESLIEDVIDKKVVLEKLPGGKVTDYQNPLNTYFKLYEKFITKSSMAIVLDLANGATVKSAKYIFNKITDNLDFIGDNPNGKNINEAVGSTHIENLVKAVSDKQFDLGFSFDGDGDRVLTVHNSGYVLDGDMMIYIFACYMKDLGILNNDTVVLTKMSNLGIIDALSKRGIQVIQTDVGDKYVVQAMEETGAVLGGESSGHVINKHLFISGDGVMNAAYLVKILEDRQSDLLSMIQDVEIYPDKLLNLRGINKELVNDIRIQNLVRDLRNELAGKGKILVRASGTEPLIRVSASAKTQEKVDEVINKIVNKFTEIS